MFIWLLLNWGCFMQVGSLPSAFQSGVSGYQKAEQGVADAALQISRLNTEQERVAEAQITQQQTQEAAPPPPPKQEQPNVSLEAEAVNLIVNKKLAQASAKVIKTADDMVGTLIDIKV